MGHGQLFQIKIIKILLKFDNVTFMKPSKSHIRCKGSCQHFQQFGHCPRFQIVQYFRVGEEYEKRQS